MLLEKLIITIAAWAWPFSKPLGGPTVAARCAEKRRLASIGKVQVERFRRHTWVRP